MTHGSHTSLLLIRSASHLRIAQRICLLYSYLACTGFAEATNAPRFHHQWLPDELRVEKGFSPDTLKLLEAKGQKVALKEAMGSTQSIMVGPDGELYGASDPRSVDDLTAGY